VGIKIASYLVHGIVMPCHFTNPCTSYRISVGVLSFKESIPKISSWGIGKLLGTTSIVSRCPMNETWTESNDSTKPSVTPIISNLSSLRICVFVYILLALIWLCLAPVSSMKTRSEINSTEIVMMSAKWEERCRCTDVWWMKRKQWQNSSYEHRSFV